MIMTATELLEISRVLRLTKHAGTFADASAITSMAAQELWEDKLTVWDVLLWRSSKAVSH